MAPNPVPIAESAFHRVVDWTIQAEGGGVLHSHPDDPGGMTKFGISARSHPNVNIRGLTRTQAEAIYHNKYWLPIHGDQLPPPLALVVFDTAVNTGVFQATKLLQRLLGVRTDGKFGPKTLAAARVMSLDMLPRLTAARDELYENLVWTRPANRAFRDGWRNRVHRLAVEAGRWLERGQ